MSGEIVGGKVLYINKENLEDLVGMKGEGESIECKDYLFRN